MSVSYEKHLKQEDFCNNIF